MPIVQGSAGKTLRNKLILIALILFITGFVSFVIFKSSGPILAPLAPIMALFVIVRLLSSPTISGDVFAYAKGYAGEATMGKLLETLPTGWRVLHDLDLGGENVDHLVIGPGGAFNLEVKNYSGKVLATPNGLYNKGQKLDKVVKQTWRQSHKLREILGVEVVPILVFVTDRLEGDHVGRLMVMTPQQAANYLKPLSKVWEYQEFMEAANKAEKLIK